MQPPQEYRRVWNITRTKCKHTRTRSNCVRPAGSRLGHAAARVVGPVAVEADDAKFDAKGGADHAEVLADPVIDGAGALVGHHGDAAAVAARDGIRRPAPGPKGGFAHAVDFHDEQGGLPEGALLLG